MTAFLAVMPVLVVAALIGAAGSWAWASHTISRLRDALALASRAPGYDAEAVRAAGDRAYLAVAAEQATRVPRRDRPRPVEGLTVADMPARLAA